MTLGKQLNSYRFIALPIERHHVDRELAVNIPLRGRINVGEHPAHGTARKGAGV